jgi:hypothetical protein
MSSGTAACSDLRAGTARSCARSCPPTPCRWPATPAVRSPGHLSPRAPRHVRAGAMMCTVSCNDNGPPTEAQ